MFFKKLKNKTISFLLLLLLFPSSVFAYSDYIIPGGESIGIQIKTNGIMIVGMYTVGSSSPGKDAGLRIGDMITEVDSEKVSSIDNMITTIKSSNTKTINITYYRSDVSKNTSLKLVRHSDNTYKTGLYVKDSVTGVGTLTFIDPETKYYGVLGHEIMEKSSMKLVPANNGKIFKSSITSIEKSKNGDPGEKNARFYSNDILGAVKENTYSGVFGKWTSSIDTSKALKIADFNQIEIGPAAIRTVINGTKVEQFEVEILRTSNSSDTKNILFKITDENLLNKTEGIVQGMSGSPILQNNMIIGAVTHVVIDDATKGYGIYIKNMLEEAEN